MTKESVSHKSPILYVTWVMAETVKVTMRIWRSKAVSLDGSSVLQFLDNMDGKEHNSIQEHNFECSEMRDPTYNKFMGMGEGKGSGLPKINIGIC